MLKGNIAARACKIYIKKIWITLSSNTVHRIEIDIVIKPRYCMDFVKKFILKIDNFGIFPIYFSSKKLLRTTGSFRAIKVA